MPFSYAFTNTHVRELNYLLPSRCGRAPPYLRVVHHLAILKHMGVYTYHGKYWGGKGYVL